MSTSSKVSPRIVIVGGGIAGLTLAIALEKFHIDYILIEAHDNIPPPVGASIGLMPNGLLILDQLGCYEAIRAVSQEAKIGASHIRDRNGKSLACTMHMFDQLEKRHGYPMLFFDRQWLLQVLYDQIEYKERIILSSRVALIKHTGSGVEVITEQGNVYSGVMVVGADGIHSVVRREMIRIASKASSKTSPTNEDDRMACHYKCSFGIAQDVAQWPEMEQCFTTGRGTTFLVASGPQNRLYWFLFVKLPDVKYGKDIPRYTKDDEADFVNRYHALHITESLTFGQVYAKRLTSALTPLHEVVFEKWFFNRILIIGDSAHKPNPIGGMGGNGAVESVAEFINALLHISHDRSNRLHELTSEEFDSVFLQMQSARYERAKFAVSTSHDMQTIFAFENPILSYLIWHIMTPLSGDDSSLGMLGYRVVGGSRIRRLPIPFRPRVIPFTHELPETPFSAGRGNFIRLVHIVAMGYLFWKSITPQSAQSQNSSSSQMPLIYSFSQSLTALLIVLIEGYRIGNVGTPLSLVPLFTLSFQIWGIPRILPLYGILSACFSFDNPAGRFIYPDTVKWLLASLLLGYVIPTAIMLSLTQANHQGPELVILARCSPLVLQAFVVSTSYLSRQTKANEKGTENVFERYKKADMHILQFAYKVVLCAQVAIHLVTLWGTLQPLGLSMWWNIQALVLDWLPLDDFFGNDLWLTIAAVEIYGLFCVWNLRGKGFISTAKSIQASIFLTVGQIIMGPGAAWISLWSWREDVISGLSTLED